MSTSCCTARRTVIAAVIAFHACGAFAEEPSAEPRSVPAPFEPGEISIGEPIRLPSRQPAAVPAPGAARAAVQPPAVPGRAAAPTAGNGWIGLTVDEKLVTGRLVVVDVAAAGPAERAGIRPQDHLLAIDGTPLHTADQLAAALAAIAPGSSVKVAVARGDQVDEISLQALARPTVSPARDWQPAESAAAPVARTIAPPRPPVGQPPALPGPFQPAAPPPAADTAATISPAVGDQARGRTALGVRTLPVDPTVQARFQLPEPAGALVIGVVHDLPASKAGVPPGSVIVALDDQPVRSPTELTRIVTSGPVGRPVTLQYILPGGEKRRAEVSLQSLEVPLERALVGPEE